MAQPEKNISIDLARAVSFLKDIGLIKKQETSTLNSEKSNIHTDSRAVAKGDIFIAYRGESTDSHKFIPDVMVKRPGLVIIEDPSFIDQLKDTPWILVENSREAWSYLCAEASDFSSNEMTFIGVTGTNGKTSTVWIIKELLKLQNIPYLSIGTLGIWMNDEFYESKHTTPDPNVLFPLLSDAAKQGISVCVMEVSSHAMEQRKLAPIRFKASAFTSFSRDHLDLHGDMDHYLEAKLKLFRNLQERDSFKLFHSSLFRLAAVSKLKLPGMKKYGLENNLSYTFRNGVSELQIREPDCDRVFTLPLLGSFLIENAAAAILLLEATLNTKIKLETTNKIKPIPGRLELVRRTDKEQPTVVVDYAHTPDAIEKSLQALRPFCSGDLTVVFGCGGNRDKGKRPLMAKSAEQFADKVVVTTDNPRDEDPHDIINDILDGFLDRSEITVEVDRKKAIESAIAQASSKDLILVAGKGHETYMEISGKRTHFSDTEVAQNALRS